MRAVTVSCSLLLCVGFAFGQNTALRWYSFSSGFEISSSASSHTKSSIGQTLIGSSQGASSIVISGFLADTLLRSRVVAVNEQSDLPITYALHQNYPNPFNPTTTIKYQLPASVFVTLKVFDIVGREVATLVSDFQQPGYYTAEWNAGGIASGVYFYRIQAGSFAATRKLMLLR
ncbi:MAG TPA: T9SS type A sorting domain-containing protein [Bacteroidota bacterium]|nr:T9SS type A sorting domain-containing protein [Bacteroidota bacterium]